MIEATKQMMAAEGAAAMTYGDAQGYRALRELICHKYELFEAFKAEPENIIVSNGSGQALALAFSAFLDPGDVVITEAPTFSGTLNTMRRHGPEILDVPLDDEGIVTERRPRAAGDPAPPGPALQADLHDRQLPEPRGDVPVAASGATSSSRSRTSTRR